MQLTDELAEICASALSAAEFRELQRVLRDRGWITEKCHRLLQEVDELPQNHQAVADLKAEVARDAPELIADNRLERFLLLNSASRIAHDVPQLPVAAAVKRLYRDEFGFFAAPGPEFLGMFAVRQYRFAEMCKVATLRRFPAGQLHWEISGVVRSSLRHVSPLELPKVLEFVARRLKGFRPCFRSHLNGRRKNPLLMVEAAQNLAYYRMAKSMELQPEILGYVINSWFHSPATLKVSPHLEWLNSVFLENGGLIVDMGAESPDCGVFAGNAERRKLWEEGKFQPRAAMVIWPRREMLAWAARHPELEEEPLTAKVVSVNRTQEPRAPEGHQADEAKAMIGFLRSTVLRNAKADVGMDTPLMSSGLVDSFAVIEVLHELERVTNRRISPAEVAPAELDSVAKMLRTAERFELRQ